MKYHFNFCHQQLKLPQLCFLKKNFLWTKTLKGIITGVYKCEITYLKTASISCPVVRLISKLIVVTLPSHVQLFLTRTSSDHVASSGYSSRHVKYSENVKKHSENVKNAGNNHFDIDHVTNSTIGPFSEGTHLTLQCITYGGRPPPDLYWYIGDRLGYFLNCC